MMKINNNRPKKTWQFTPKNNPVRRDLVKVDKILLKFRGRVILL